MAKHLCIHGHFYQPPREDPWLDKILPEGSAAPSTHWNERILNESYAPLAWARRLDDRGKIIELLNAYEWISFNFGPTLLKWMERAVPEHYARVLEADAKSLERWGHGNALAQVQHHVIMPLASPLDKELEVSWAVADFEARFGRRPEGMWCAETAVDTDTLEALAKQGIAFTILAPSQAKAVAALGSDDRREVHDEDFDIYRPYAVELPSGRPMAVFFYHGSLSQAVAFERLLTAGEQFFTRLSGACRDGLLSLATDGETYGHHFKFGEMALAYALDQARSERDGITLTNYAAFLAANPPAWKVWLHEPSAWSCAHGVERWRSDCGCCTGGRPDWNQKWRAPLRDCLNFLKDRIDAHFFDKGEGLFADPKAALADYGRVLSRLTTQGAYAENHFKPGLTEDQAAEAWTLLAMQESGLASFASCAWFFDEISRIEPVNGLTFALRALDLGRATGMADVENEFTSILEKAESNEEGVGTGRDIWENMVKPRRETHRTLLTQGLLRLWAEDRLPRSGDEAEAVWPGVTVRFRLDEEVRGTRPGRAAIRRRLASKDEIVFFTFRRSMRSDPFKGGLTFTPDTENAFEEGVVFEDAGVALNKRQALADAWISRTEAEAWARRLRDAYTAVTQVTDLQEAQDTLNLAERWAHLYPALAWNFIWEGDLPRKRSALLVAFLVKTGRENPERKRLCERIVSRAVELLSRPEPDFAGLARMVRRAARIELPVAWGPVQNELWRRELHVGKGAKLAKQLGFAEPEQQ